VNECKPLDDGDGAQHAPGAGQRGADRAGPRARGRGLHSSTFNLRLSYFGHPLVCPCLIDWEKTMHQTYLAKFAYVEPKRGRV